MMNTRFLADANELCRLGVGELTAGFSSGRFTPLEVAQATLARAEQVQERFNAFSLIDFDAALAMAKESTARWRSGAPVSGIDGAPTTIKDIVWVKDRVVRYGSRTTSTTPCAQDAPSVKRLRAAGAVLIGLTTTPQPFDRGHAKSLESEDDAGRFLWRRRGRGGDRRRSIAHWH